LGFDDRARIHLIKKVVVGMLALGGNEKWFEVACTIHGCEVPPNNSRHLEQIEVRIIT
jgi:hypothetical protein